MRTGRRRGDLAPKFDAPRFDAPKCDARIGFAAGAARSIAAAALAATMLLGGAGGAVAQDCEAAFASCAAACAAACAGEGAEACQAACQQDPDCVYQQRLCRNRARQADEGVAPGRSAAPRQAPDGQGEAAQGEAAQAEASKGEMAPAAADSAMPAPAMPENAMPENAAPAAAAAPQAIPRAAARTMSLDAPPPGGALEGRIFFLRRTDQEPANALFYGYLIVGPNVSQERKLAVIKGLACRLDVVDSASAAQIERLGLAIIPAQHAAAGEVTNPAEMLGAYDFPRAERWMRAAGFAADAEFAPDSAVLFVGSRSPRSRQMDVVALPGPGDLADPIIADASALSARYLERWTADIVASVRSGALKSRQDLQSLMEAHSWLEIIGEPLAAVMHIGPAPATAGEPPPSSCL